MRGVLIFVGLGGVAYLIYKLSQNKDLFKNWNTAQEQPQWVYDQYSSPENTIYYKDSAGVEHTAFVDPITGKPDLSDWGLTREQMLDANYKYMASKNFNPVERFNVPYPDVQ